MSARFQTPRGTEDVLPEEQPRWRLIEAAAAETARLFGYERIDTPSFEAADLFEKGTGDTTDIVEKEMYAFEDRGGEALSLTPEATPAICRAWLEHGMASRPQPVRLCAIARMFRYSRPQLGRLRQFTQFDCEAIGSAGALADAELIELNWRLYERLGLRDLEVRLGSIDDVGPRRAYLERLRAHYRPLRERLSPDSQRRLERNPLRLLDSNDERDRELREGAPAIVDQLSEDAAAHFAAVREALDAAGVPYSVDPLLVRGLDYYNRTVFEYIPPRYEAAQNAVGGGGRYDGLCRLLGGPDLPGVGLALGLDRILTVAGDVPPARALDAFLVVADPQRRSMAHAFARRLRLAGIRCDLAAGRRSVRAQFRAADRRDAAVAVVIGAEWDDGLVTVKELSSGDERAMPAGEVAGWLAANGGGVR